MRAPDLRPYLEEDVGEGDVTSRVFLPDLDAEAVITCEQDSVVAGLEEAAAIFSILDAEAVTLVRDGDRVKAGTEVMKVTGRMRALMTAERTALNFMMRMSGIANLTRTLQDRVDAVAPGTRVAATRKTTPGFRYFEKKAVSLGGGWTHRWGLDDMAMVKDNHIAAVGGMEAVAARMKDVPPGIRVEIEVLDLEEGKAAARAGADIVMGDHFSPADVKVLREELRKINPDILVEASGNITSENVADYAGCADIVSLGELTHSPKATHFSMDIVPSRQ